jgi:Luciferase-like monooxygenase
MDFGAAMFFTDYSMTPAALAQALEARGFESVWAPEHSHIPTSRATPFPQGGELPKKYSEVMDPFVSLTAAAVATTRLKVGTGVCLVAQRDPIQTAKIVASIDQVSGGRFLFGIGGGWNAEEMADHGTAFATRFKLMRERIAAMKEIWTKFEAEYHGELVDLPPMMSWPKPTQKPHPPGSSAAPSPMPPGAPSPMAMAGSRMPAAPNTAMLPNSCRGSGRWRPRPAATPARCRLPSGGFRKMWAGWSAAGSWASRGWLSACHRLVPTRSCRSSTVGPH